MSLRHLLPLVGEVGVDRSVEPSRAPPVMREPVKASFRSGADLGAVINVIRTNRLVNVDAAVGSGKTVRLPAEIAKGLGKLVIHVLPAELLVRDQFKYVSSQVDVPVAYMNEPQGDIPDSGILFMSCATLIARLYAGKGIGVQDVVLFLDEIHESDNFTYLCRRLAATWTWASHVVKASATFSPVGHRVMETGGNLVKKTYPKDCTVDKWNPLDDNLPWSLNRLTGSILMFVDSKVQAERLVTVYDELGLSAFRMYARMPVDVFDTAMAMMRDVNGPLVVLIADYSFRSGFNMDVSTVIDSGMVAYYAVEGGAPVMRWRPAYNLERYQGGARAARVPGSSAVYYAPDVDAPNSICDLEGVEMDAAALGFRLLGYVPPVELSGSKYYAGNVPKDIASALRGAQPLSCMSAEMLESFVCEKRRDSGVFVEEADVSSDYRSYVEPSGSYRQPVVSMGSFGAVGNPYVPLQDSLGYWEDQLERLAEMQIRDEVVVEAGKYYTAKGVSDQPRRSYGLPDGMLSVQRLMAEDNFTYRLKCLKSDDRMTALACVLDRYNALTSELDALAQVIKEDPYSKAGHVVRSDARARWAKHLMELAAGHTGELRILAEALPTLCDGVSELVVVKKGFPEVVDQFKAYHMEFANHFGAGYNADVGLDYVDGFMRQDRVTIGDAPVRSSYALQAGMHGVPGKYITEKHQRTKSNTKEARARSVITWMAGMSPSSDTLKRNKAMDPDHRFIGGTERRRLR